MPTWRLLYSDWARNGTLASVTAVLDADPAAISTSLRTRGGLLRQIVWLNPNPAVTQLLLDRGADASAPQALLESAFNPNPEVLRLLLNRNPGADATTLSAALVRAVCCNINPAITQLLLDRGAQPQSRTLQSAARNRNPAVLKLLLDRGADANAQGVIQAAARNWNPAVLELLLDRGADVNGKDFGGWTALHNWAGQIGRLNGATARLLLNRGADINATRGGSEVTPLDMAEISGNYLAQQILRQAGANSRPDSHDSTVRFLADTPLSFVLEQLEWLPPGDKPLEDLEYIGSWLRYAARNPDPAVLELLLDRGADVNGKDFRGWTALHSAAQNSNPAVAELLIEHGADIQAPGPDGLTPLHWAARSNSNPAVAELLIDRGAIVSAPASVENATPLHYAARYSPNPAMTETLIALGADAEVKNDGGATPLLLSWLNPTNRVTATLEDQGATHVVLADRRLLDAAWLKDATALQVEAQVINASVTDIRARDGCGRTPLHLLAHYTALSSGSDRDHFLRGWRVFFERSANTVLREFDSSGNTAFHYAVAGAARVDVNASLYFSAGWAVSVSNLFSSLLWATGIDALAKGGGGLQAAHYSGLHAPRGLWGDFSEGLSRVMEYLVMEYLDAREWLDPEAFMLDRFNNTVTVIDPETGLGFPNNIIPESRFDSCITSLP